MSDFTFQPSPLADGRAPRQLTQSAVNLFGTCRRKFHWSINERLEPLVKARPLTFGDYWHRVMAAHYKWIAATTKDRLLFESSSDAMPNPHDELQMHVERARNLDFDVDEAIEDEALATAMYNEWCLKFPPMLDGDKWAILGIECTLRAPIPDLNGEDSDWEMAGTLDLLVQERTANKIIVVDHKSTAMGRDAFYPNLDLSFQGWDYCWLASHALKQNVNNVLFQGARKKAPSIPEPLKSTGMPSTANSKIPDTTFGIFSESLRNCRALLEHGDSPQDAKEAKAWAKVRDAGLAVERSEYEPILSALQARDDGDGNAFVWRKKAHITAENLKRFERDIYFKAIDIAQERMWNTSLDACDQIGRSCKFKPLCIYGDGPTSRMGFKQRDGYMPSIKKLGEEE